MLRLKTQASESEEILNELIKACRALNSKYVINIMQLQNYGVNRTKEFNEALLDFDDPQPQLNDFG